MAAPSTVFLKLGGSLITDKSSPRTARTGILARLAAEIAGALAEQPELRLVAGHGSGSFGHVTARKFGTRSGVSTADQWRGFATVWHHAAELNHLVVDALRGAGVPAMAFPPSAACLTDDGQIVSWPVEPIRNALARKLVPVVYGDVTFDRTRGGTIVSTEDVFGYLAGPLQPARVLIAGIEAGVWADYPKCTRLVDRITPASYTNLQSSIQGSANTDVTGGMDAKVRQMLSLVRKLPGTEVLIFGGLPEGAVQDALAGGTPGTRITAA